MSYKVYRFSEILTNKLLIIKNRGLKKANLKWPCDKSKSCDNNLSIWVAKTELIISSLMHNFINATIFISVSDNNVILNHTVKYSGIGLWIMDCSYLENCHDRQTSMLRFFPLWLVFTSWSSNTENACIYQTQRHKCKWSSQIFLLWRTKQSQKLGIQYSRHEIKNSSDQKGKIKDTFVFCATILRRKYVNTQGGSGYFLIT